jgi:hypothetical protein
MSFWLDPKGPKGQGCEFPGVRESGVGQIQGHALLNPFPMQYAYPAWLRIRHAHLRFPVQAIQGQKQSQHGFGIQSSYFQFTAISFLPAIRIHKKEFNFLQEN